MANPWRRRAHQAQTPKKGPKIGLGVSTERLFEFLKPSTLFCVQIFSRLKRTPRGVLAAPKKLTFFDVIFGVIDCADRLKTSHKQGRNAQNRLSVCPKIGAKTARKTLVARAGSRKQGETIKLPAFAGVLARFCHSPAKGWGPKPPSGRKPQRRVKN